MTSLARSVAAAAGLLGACALLALGAGVVGAKGNPKVPRSTADSGTAKLAVTRVSSTGAEYASASDYDKLLGAGASTYVIKARVDKTGIHVTAKPVVFYTADGSLTGTATGTANVKASGETVDGKLSLTVGRGGQKGHSFTGTFIAKSDKTFTFFTLNYKGAYK